MNDYAGEARKRSQNLLVVEGKHEKNKLFWLIFKCFPEINIEMDDVWIYGTNIYVLYEDIVKEYGSTWTEDDDIDLPFVISKKQRPDSRCYKKDFTNIILVFDMKISSVADMDNKLQEILQDVIDDDSQKTLKNLIKDWLKKLEYVHKGQTYWEHMRSIFKQIIYHNICKAYWIQNNQYQIEREKYRACFEELDLTEILKVQNISSQDIETGYIWVLNTCVFLVAEYNFGLVT